MTDQQNGLFNGPEYKTDKDHQRLTRQENKTTVPLLWEVN